MSAYERLAAAVLVAHQRRDMASCLCGWSELGRSHAEHVASVLGDAGALNVPPAFRGDAGGSLLGDVSALRHQLREAERERDEAHEAWQDAVLHQQQAVRERDQHRAEARRYREALERIRRPAGVGPGLTRDDMRGIARRVLDGGTP